MACRQSASRPLPILQRCHAGKRLWHENRLAVAVWPSPGRALWRRAVVAVAVAAPATVGRIVGVLASRDLHRMSIAGSLIAGEKFVQPEFGPEEALQSSDLEDVPYSRLRSRPHILCCKSRPDPAERIGASKHIPATKVGAEQTRGASSKLELNTNSPAKDRLITSAGH